MTTITYQCSVCSRKIDIAEKPQGINVFSKCIITNGCRGKLNKLSRNQDNIRESFPEPVLGLDDYVPRKAFHSHSQTALNSVWLIKHELGAVPAIDVFVQTGNSTKPEDLQKLDIKDYQIAIIDKNNCTITFPVPYRGIAHLVARTSTQEVELISENVDSLLRVTFGGVFVLGIPKFLTQTNPPQILDQVPVGIRVSVTEPNKEEVICTETIPLTVINSTPWVGWNELLLRKRRNYLVRYLSIFSFTKTFSIDNLVSASIPNQTIVKFLEINFGNGYKPIEQGDLILVYANSPYQAIDKVKNRIIDIGSMIKNNYDHFVYQNGELYTVESNVQHTYPMIEKVR